jgi:hypothetical protein
MLRRAGGQSSNGRVRGRAAGTAQAEPVFQIRQGEPAVGPLVQSAVDRVRATILTGLGHELLIGVRRPAGSVGSAMWADRSPCSTVPKLCPRPCPLKPAHVSDGSREPRRDGLPMGRRWAKRLPSSVFEPAPGPPRLHCGSGCERHATLNVTDKVGKSLSRPRTGFCLTLPLAQLVPEARARLSRPTRAVAFLHSCRPKTAH